MTKTQKKRPPKTPKERSFAREYIKTGNATEAASRAYDTKSRDVARNIGSQNVAKLSFNEIFDNHGLTDGFLIESLVKATRATKYSYSQKIADWSTRIKAIEMSMRLKGTFKMAEAQLKSKLEESEVGDAQQVFEDSLSGERKEMWNMRRFGGMLWSMISEQLSLHPEKRWPFGTNR